MPKHNTYEQDENISDNDIVLGSDAEDNLKTKNYRIGKLKDYFLSFVETIVVNPRPYKVYTALLTQTGTNAPVATVLENTLGEVVWSYNDESRFSATSDNLFTLNKTVVFTGSVFNGGITKSVYIIIDNNNFTTTTLNMETFCDDGFMNGLLSNTPIEIRVYN